MNWKQLAKDPNLQNLPYKIELNEWGQIVLTSRQVKHGAFQFKIGNILDNLMGDAGQVVTECAIQTTQGTKVADVAWFSEERWKLVKDDYDASIAPEICVEVRSPGNSSDEMKNKRKLYFASGAGEVWVCDTKGKIKFYDPTGEISNSILIPAFPKLVTL